jgi:hypothetical protein
MTAVEKVSCRAGQADLGRIFLESYVRPGRPVLFHGLLENWPALEHWNLERFAALRDVWVATKLGDVSEGKLRSLRLSDYANQIAAFEARMGEQPAYLHDVPIFHLAPSLLEDIGDFPVALLPPWYRRRWWAFVQFFMGPTGAKTPLHFDTLLTHNLFFHIRGTKKFTLISREQRQNCYLHTWRWSHANAEQPDLDQHPLMAKVSRTTVTVRAGDVLYMPPGTLHQVTGLDQTVSFNIDWHTPRSAGQGILSVLRGAPARNLYYNTLVMIGVGLRVPERLIFPLYKPYLNLIS